MPTTSSAANSATPTAIHSGGKRVPCSVPGARGRPSLRGGSTTTAPEAYAPGATGASAPSRPLPIPCCIRVSNRCHTGFWPRFCCVCRVRLAASPENSGAVSIPAIAGAGGCATPHCLLRGFGNSTAQWKPMTFITRPATRAKPKAVGRRARGRRQKREPGRGHFDKDRPAMIAWVSRQGQVVLQATRDCTVKTVQHAANLAVQAGSTLYRDSTSSSRAV
jgi:hypothetical protein